MHNETPDSSERSSAERTAWRISNSQAARFLARGGLISSGVVHILIGILSIGVALGLRQRADQSGALSVISNVPGGVMVLWIAALALLGLAVWQWTGPVGTRPQGVLPNKVRDRFKSLAYLFVGCVVAVFAAGGRSNSATTTHAVSSALIAAPGGVFVLAAIGVAVGIVGGVFISRGVSRRFTEDLDLPQGRVRAVVLTVGVIGHCGKGLALELIALLFVGAAFLHTSNWSTGLDGAVRFLTSLPTGIWPLLVITIGLITQGVYLILRTRYMKR